MNVTHQIKINFEVVQNECRHVYEIYDNYERCHFVRNTESCAYDGVIYNYTELFFCQFINMQIINLVVLFAILLALFISIGIVADDFLCPSLLTISKVLRLPDNIAGVTFLAFGNGAADIFASVEGISHSKIQLIFSSLYGAGIFVTTVVAGSILLIDNFTIIKTSLIHDIIFYIGAVFLVWLIIYQRIFKIGHAIALVCYYFFYIMTTIISRFLYLHLIRKTKALEVPEIFMNGEAPKIHELDVTSVSKSNPSSLVFLETINRKHSTLSYNSNTFKNRDRKESIEDEVILARLYRTGTMKSTGSSTRSMSQHFAHYHWSNTIRSVSKAFEDVEEVNHTIEHLKNYADKIIIPNQKNRPDYVSQFSMIELMSETKNFLIHICPVDIFEWDNYSYYKKTTQLIKAIPYFIMTICIPIVDLESINENWCRILICLNIFFAPQIVLLLKRVHYNINDKFPLWSLIMIISIVLIFMVFLTSDKNKPPVYHRLFAFVGFIISIIFINSIAIEIINILQTFGIIFQLSDSILGLTILAWGNSIGDLISNLSMARHGYYGIAIAACFGGPMLNLLIGLGVPYLILFVGEKKSSINLKYTKMISLLYATLIISLCISLVAFLLIRFRSSKIHGFILIFVYICYIIMTLLFEFEVIQMN